MKKCNTLKNLSIINLRRFMKISTKINSSKKITKDNRKRLNKCSKNKNKNQSNDPYHQQTDLLPLALKGLNTHQCPTKTLNTKGKS